MKQQRFAKVRVLYGGSEVTNSPRTFLHRVNSGRDIRGRLGLEVHPQVLLRLRD